MSLLDLVYDLQLDNRVGKQVAARMEANATRIIAALQPLAGERTAEPVDLVALAEKCGAEIGRYEGEVVWIKFHQPSLEPLASALAATAQKPAAWTCHAPEVQQAVYEALRRAGESAEDANRMAQEALAAPATEPTAEPSDSESNAYLRDHTASAKPAGEVVSLRPCGYVSVDGTARLCRKCGQVHADPLYTSPIAANPPGAEDARDAARYRWLRSIDSYSEWERVGHYADDALDKLVDAALSSQCKKEGQC